MGEDDLQVSLVDALLGHDPPGLLLAIGENGLAVPMPAEVPVGLHRVAEGAGSALDLVVTDDHHVVVDVWMRLREHGSAFGAVRLRADPAQPATLQAVDARPQFGVYLALLVGSSTGPGEAGAEGPLRPRYGTVRKDETATLIEIDDAVARMLGWRREDVLGRPPLELVHPEDRPRAIAHWIDLLTHPGCTRRVRMRQLSGRGEWIWCEVTNHHRLQDPAVGCVLTEMIDITEEMSALEALRAKEELLTRLTESLPVGVVQLDEQGLVVHRNDRAEALLGIVVPLGEPLVARLAGRLGDDRLPDGLAEVLCEGSDVDTETALTVGGRLRRLSVSVRALRHSADGARPQPGWSAVGAIVCLTDATAALELRERLRHQATIDELTGCLSRSATIDELTGLLTGDVPVTVLFADLDGFKPVNDRYGHAVGDEVLREVGRRLRDTVRAGDVVGRLGGDEFLVASCTCSTEADAERLATRVAAAVAVPLVISGTTLQVGVSVGVSRADPGTPVDAVVESADADMYRVKAARNAADTRAPSGQASKTAAGAAVRPRTVG